MKTTLIGTVGICLLASAPLALASDLPDTQLRVENYKGIPYVSGGFGIEEREKLRAMGQNDDLEISFAWQNKQFLGGAKVLIKDDKGKEVLKAVSDGPLFFTKLPTGKYTIEATAMGKTLKQAAHIPSKGQARVYFAWKKSDHETAT